MIGDTSGARTAQPSEAHNCIPCFCYSIKFSELCFQEWNFTVTLSKLSVFLPLSIYEWTNLKNVFISNNAYSKK